MVCNRCKMVVKDELIQFGLHPVTIELGEVEIVEEINTKNKKELNNVLLSFGFELMDDKRSRLIERIKNIIVGSVHHLEEQAKTHY